MDMYAQKHPRSDVPCNYYRAIPLRHRNFEGSSKFTSASLSYAINITNIVVLVTGTATLSIGAWLRTNSRFRDFLSQRYRNVVEEAFWQAPTLYIFSYMLILLGLCMIVIAVLGCCGIVALSSPILIIYGVAMFMLMFCTISALAYIIFKKYGIDIEVADALTYMVQNYYQGAGIIQESLDHLQEAFRCCGNAGCGDFRFLHLDPPRSCDIRCDGCHYRIMLALRVGFTTTFVVFTIVVIIEFVAAAAAVILAMKLKCFKRCYIGEMGFRKNLHEKGYHWRPSDLDVDLLERMKYPISEREHFEQFNSPQRY